MTTQTCLTAVQTCSLTTQTCRKVKEVYTITFGDVAENHVGMQKIGTISERGFDGPDLIRAADFLQKLGCEVELINLSPSGCAEDYPPAYILVARDAVNVLLNDEGAADKMYIEQSGLEYDSKAKMRGRVVNKKARFNLCFGNDHQDADYDNGKGTIYAFEEVPLLMKLREMLGEMLTNAKNLNAESNYYYDISTCGIGYHGDAERKKVIAVRLAGKKNDESVEPDSETSMPICYAWYKKFERVGEIIKIDLYHGDMYIMSEKATGYDWKKSSIYTLRHATGCDKYTS